MSKAYCFDFDETLMDANDVVLPTFDIFKQAVQSNKPVWIITARPPTALHDIHNLLVDYNLTKLPKERIVAVGHDAGFEERKCEYLQTLVDMGYDVEFWDDHPKTIKLAKLIKGVKAHQT
jgi:hypothetical protein